LAGKSNGESNKKNQIMLPEWKDLRSTAPMVSSKN